MPQKKYNGKNLRSRHLFSINSNQISQHKDKAASFHKNDLSRAQKRHSNDHSVSDKLKMKQLHLHDKLKEKIIYYKTKYRAKQFAYRKYCLHKNGQELIEPLYHFQKDTKKDNHSTTMIKTVPKSSKQTQFKEVKVHQHTKSNHNVKEKHSPYGKWGNEYL